MYLNSQSPFESYNLLIHLNKKNLKEVNIGLDFLYLVNIKETLYQRGLMKIFMTHHLKVK